VTPVDTFARDNLPPRAQWPELLIEPLGYPERLNCAVALLDDAVAAGHAERAAVRSPDVVLTYRELQSQVDRIARVLCDDLGLVSGNRVLLRAPNTPFLVASWLAVAKAGGIVVATMPLLRRRELAEIVERARIELALCDDRLLAEVEGLCDVLVPFGEVGRRAEGRAEGFEACDTAADDVVLIAFTSGTTGRPKGTMHFHRDVLAICDTFSREIVRPTADDVFIGSPPIAFTFGLGGLVAFPLRVGASTVLLEQASPDALLEAIPRYGATVLFTAPTGYRRMLAIGTGDRLRTLRRCISAGETLPAAVWEAWHAETGIRIIDGIGATEMLHVFISAADDDIRPGATGRPVPGYEARVVDDELRAVGPGVVGRLAVRGPTGCRYLDDPRQLDYVVDGWNLTGDAYSVDADGYFHFQARTDDMIVTGGYNIAGPEVEEALIEHAAVLECAVVGAPDEARGQIVQAYVVPAPGRAADDDLARELQDFVKARIAPYKYPRAVVFVDALPRTETGKVQRFVLRERAARGDGWSS
jgi:2-aminobenzoate-CoA ligase